MSTGAPSDFIDKIPSNFAVFRELRRGYINAFGYPPYAFKADVCDWLRRNAPTEDDARRAVESVDRYHWE